MGNILRGSRRTTEVMKMNGETLKLKTPVRAGEVVKNHPGLVVMDSRAVRLHGAAASPLEASQELEPKRVYFLVEPPKNNNDNDNDKDRNNGTRESGGACSTRSMGPRRVRSGINMSAKDRLEGLMMARRSVSDLSVATSRPESVGGGATRVRVRLPKAEVERLVRESRDEAEAAEKIVEMCRANDAARSNVGAVVARKGGVAAAREQKRVSFLTGDEEVRAK